MGSLAPLMTAPLLVQLHVAAGVAALLVGGFRVAAPHHERWDRRLGWGFLGLLVLTALLAAPLTRPDGAPNLFGFTLGHLFIALTALGVFAAFRTARSPDRLRWRTIVTALFAGVLLTCGLFELTPGRLMNTVLAGG